MISYSDGTSIAVWFDQGLSYWGLARQQLRTPVSVFTVDQDANALGAKLAEIKIGVEGHDLPTQIYFEAPNPKS